MRKETEPILFKTPKEFETIEIYPIHDLHYGSAQFNKSKWEAVKKDILSSENKYVIWVGDLMEDAIPTSKSSVFEQRYSIIEQREFISQQFKDLAEKTIACCDGNHEYNRSTKAAGLYPLYDCCCIAGIQDRYRSAFAIIDVSVGYGAAGHNQNQFHYTIFATHRAKTLKNFASCDELEGFDIFLSGHDHEPTDRPRAKLYYNQVRHTVSIKNIENINCGSFIDWAGGYASRIGLRPQSDKYYKIILSGREDKKITTCGFYL